MKRSTFFDFQNCSLSNDLWPNFINKVGISKARIAVRQSLDLQIMQGTSNTVPVLIIETCGSALASSQAIRTTVGLYCDQKGMILLYSTKLNSFQLLRNN